MSIDYLIRCYYAIQLMFAIWHKENWATFYTGKLTSWWEAYQVARIVWEV